MEGKVSTFSANSNIDELRKRRSGEVGAPDRDSSGFNKYISDRGDEEQPKRNKLGYKDLMEEARMAGDHENPLEKTGAKIADREDKYLQRKKLRAISPPRYDPFKDPSKTAAEHTRSYVEIVREQKLENERHEILLKVAKEKEEQHKRAAEKKLAPKEEKKEPRSGSASSAGNLSTQANSEWEGTERPSKSKWDSAVEATPKRNRWDLTPVGEGVTPGRSRFGETPTPGRWDSTTPGARFGETPRGFGETPGRKSRWDDKTPVVPGGSMTPSAYGGFTPTPVSFEK